MDNLLNRILEKCRMLDIKENKLLSDLNINSSFFSDWKKKKLKSPSYDKIVKISEYLNVSLDYLTYGKENFSDLSEDEENIIKIYRQLEDKDKYKLLGMFELKLSETYSKKEKLSNLEDNENIS